MCNSRKDALATNPRPKPRTPKPSSSASAGTNIGPSSSTSSAAQSTGGLPTSSSAGTSTGRSTGTTSKPSTSSTSSHASLASLREFLPELPVLYPFSEICAATNNFLAKRLSSSSSNSWRCSLRGKDAVVFQRRFRGDPAALRRRLASNAKAHHTSIARLLGASLGGGYIYLVYEYVNGASLADCLRNPRNPSYTPLVTWVDRMQVATDLAQGLEYIHCYAATGAAALSADPKSKGDRGGPRRRPVHNRITSSGVMITDPQLRAKICHFGAADLAGEIPSSDSDDEAERGKSSEHEISEISEESSHVSPKLQRSGSREMRFEGTRGYIAPEVVEGGSVSQKSDVFAFGVVLLELLTGEEPVRYRYDRETKGYERVSLVETATEVMGPEEEEEEGEAAGPEAANAERHRRIRRWVDRRLKDSYPVEVAEKAVRVALDCVRAEPAARPDMARVAGKVSRLLLQSRAWADKVRVPAEFSVSMAPR